VSNLSQTWAFGLNSACLSLWRDRSSKNVPTPGPVMTLNLKQIPRCLMRTIVTGCSKTRHNLHFNVLRKCTLLVRRLQIHYVPKFQKGTSKLPIGTSGRKSTRNMTQMPASTNCQERSRWSSSAPATTDYDIICSISSELERATSAHIYDTEPMTEEHILGRCPRLVTIRKEIWPEGTCPHGQLYGD
jgi:hypothetical protein